MRVNERNVEYFGAVFLRLFPNHKDDDEETDVSPTLLSFFVYFFSALLALIFSIGCLALLFQNNISFLLIFSDIDNRI